MKEGGGAEGECGTREEPGTLIQGAPVFPGSSRLGIEPKTPGWLVQDPTTSPLVVYFLRPSPLQDCVTVRSRFQLHRNLGGRTQGQDCMWRFGIIGVATRYIPTGAIGEWA